MTTEQRVWAVIYAVNGTTQLGTVTNLINPRTRRRVNAVGDFAFSVPATDPVVAQLAISRYVDIYYSLATVNPRFRGRIDVIAHVVDERDQHLVHVSGSSLAAELVDAPTYMGVNADNITAEATSDLLLAGLGWTNTVTGAGFVSLTERFDNMTVWAAHAWLTQQQGGYLRETNTARELELKRGATASGVRLQNASALSLNASPTASLGLIKRVGRIRQDGTRIINRIVPLGLHEDNTIYDLGLSNRSSPYTIQSFIKNRPSIVEVVTIGQDGAESKEVPINCLGTNRVVLLFLSTDYGTPAQDPLPTMDGHVMHRIGDTADPDAALWIGFPARGKSRISLPTQNTGHAAVAISLRDCQFDPSQITHVNALTDSIALGSSGTLRDIDAQRQNTAHTSASLALTSDDDDLCLNFIFFPGNGADPTVVTGAGQTQLADFTCPLPATDGWMWASRENGSDSGVTLSATFSSRTASSHIAVSIKPAVTYYIEDSASVTAHLRRVLMIIESAQKLLGASSSQLQNAANTLYDVAAAQLTRQKDPPTFYEDVELVNDISDSWLPGDSLEVNGVFTVEDPAGTQRAWLNIDATLFAIEVEESWDRDAVRTWNLRLATQYEWDPTNEHEIAEMRRRLKALEAVA